MRTLLVLLFLVSHVAMAQSPVDGGSKTLQVDARSSCKVKVHVKELDCNSSTTGAIGVEHISGTEPFTYEWSNGATTKDIYGLKPGFYTVKVTDANGASDYQKVTLKAPLEIKVLTTVKNVSAKGQKDGSIIIKGVKDSYSIKCMGPGGIKITGKTELHNLPEGNYTIMVADNKSCTTISKVKIGASGTSVK